MTVTPSAPTSPDNGEAGTTLVELMVAMAILMVVMALVLPAYLALHSSEATTAAMTTDDTVIVPALRQLGAEVTNATLLASPCASGTNASTPACQGGTPTTPPSGFAVLLTYDAPGSGAPTCSQWRVFGGVLQSRSWSPSTTTAVAFATEAAGVSIANTTSPWQPPFALEATTGAKAQILDVDLVLQSATNIAGQELKTSMDAQAVAPSVSGATEPTCTPPPSS